MGRGPSTGRGHPMTQGLWPPRGTGPPAGYPSAPRENARVTAAVADMFENAPLDPQCDVDQVEYIGAAAGTGTGVILLSKRSMDLNIIDC